MPLPVKAAVKGPFVALLVKVMLPEEAPLARGANVTVKAALCPAAMVAGSDRPPRVNSALLEVAAETVTLAPLAVRVPALFCVEPTVTFPNEKVPGEIASWPGLVPVPVNDKARFGTAPVAVKA